MRPPTDFYLWASTLCAKQECCAADLRTKLLAKGALPAQADAVIERLFAERFLDEQRYANAFVMDKFRFAHWGKIKIGYMLRLKGIGSSTIDEAIDRIPEKEYEQAAREFLESKARGAHAADHFALRAKLIRSAMQRGYESALIQRLLQQMPSADSDFDD